MANYGDEKDCGGYTRRYYDSKWDLIISNDRNYYWRDKENHQTYECDSSVIGTTGKKQLGNQVEMFDDDNEDDSWE